MCANSSRRSLNIIKERDTVCLISGHRQKYRNVSSPNTGSLTSLDIEKGFQKKKSVALNKTSEAETEAYFTVISLYIFFYIFIYIFYYIFFFSAYMLINEFIHIGSRSSASRTGEHH